MRKLGIILIVLGYGLSVLAQQIPVPLTQVKLYDFIDELLSEGVIVHQTAIRPYTRKQVANMLLEAQTSDSLLSIRQQFSAFSAAH